MSTIGSLEINPGVHGTVEWENDSRQVRLSIENLHQAMLFEVVELVIVLTGSGDFANELTAYRASGEMLFCVPAPDGFAFSYISKHPDLSIAVVASSTREKIDGWYDWYFGVNPKDGELTKHCPAY